MCILSCFFEHRVLKCSSSIVSDSQIFEPRFRLLYIYIFFWNTNFGNLGTLLLGISTGENNKIYNHMGATARCIAFWNRTKIEQMVNFDLPVFNFRYSIFAQNFFRRKIFLVKFFRPKVLLTKLFRAKNIFVPKKHFQSKLILSAKNNFSTNKFIFRSKFIFRPTKIVFGQKSVVTLISFLKFCLAIFFWKFWWEKKSISYKKIFFVLKIIICPKLHCIE